jgi:hypothetical protein
MDRSRKLSTIVITGIVLALLPWSSYAGDQGEQKEAEKRTAAAENVLDVTLRTSLSSPLFAEFPVAVVNGENITLGELGETMAMSHEESEERPANAPKVKYMTFLDRLITVRLFAQEAENMGIAEIPEIKNGIEQFSKGALRRAYMAELVKDVKADPDEVEKVYKDIVREWKVRSVMFRKEADAKKMADLVKAGTSFEEAADQALREGISQGDSAGYLRRTQLPPSVVEMLLHMRAGSVSSVLTTGAGKHTTYSLMKLEEIRYRDDPAERVRAQEDVLNIAKGRTLEKYRKDWYKKNVKVKKKLLADLDFESGKPSPETLLLDRRTLAEIRGEKPITVADLTASLMGEFYHGQESMKLKKANGEKQRKLEDIINKRMLQQEALRHGIDKTPVYKATVRDYEATLLFSTFISKVIVPQAKVTEEGKKTYYQEHLNEFPNPVRMNLSSLAFENKKDAETALEMLKKGTAFNWLRENAEGQLSVNIENLTILNGSVVMVENLSADIRSALAGAKAGDFRLAHSPAVAYYVFAINDVTAPGVLPYEQVASTIESRLVAADLDRIVKEWAEKLRQLSEIKIYLVESRN